MYNKCHTNQTKNNKKLLKHCKSSKLGIQIWKKIIRPVEKSFKLNIQGSNLMNLSYVAELPAAGSNFNN